MTAILRSAPLKFLVVGGANTAIGLALIYLLKWLGSVGDVSANICGYGLGLATSFFLNRSWTFHHVKAWIPAAARFLVVFAVAYAANLSTVLTLVDKFGLNAYFAQALGIAPYTVLFYLGSRHFAFR